MEPSPTAEATRLTEPWRTSPVRGHEKVPVCGQVEVLAGGQL